MHKSERIGEAVQFRTVHTFGEVVAFQLMSREKFGIDSNSCDD
jgi:hypothetical protein